MHRTDDSVVVNSLEHEALQAKGGVRLLNSFLGGIDTEIDDEDDDDNNHRYVESKKTVSKPSIHDRVQITAHRRLSAERFGVDLLDTKNCKQVVSKIFS